MDKILRPIAHVKVPGTEVAAAGAAASVAALFSAAACCILPLALAALGLGAGGLAAFVPYHWPLTIASAVVVAIGWLLYVRERGACAVETECASPSRHGATMVFLCIATAAVALSAAWPHFIEQPLMKLLGSA